MKKLFIVNILWGFMSGMMGYSITTEKGFLIWALGTTIFTILTWDEN